MAEENLSPISAAKPPAVNPLGAATSSHAATLKLKPVIRKPVAGAARPAIKPVPAAAPAAEPPAAAPASSMEQLKTVTQKLKGVTQQIPQQAILHKTGIIADQNLTEAQKQASKSRTSRISLSDALGVAPVQNDAAPMKTIRIRRPSDLQNPSSTTLKPMPSSPAPAPAPAAQAPAEEQEAEASVTQRKTLKISRPGGGAVRPGKFGVKKPGAAAPKPADDSDVGDIEDIPDTQAQAQPAYAAAAAGNTVADVPNGLLVFDFILQFAACVAVGFLGWLLYTDLQTAWF